MMACLLLPKTLSAFLKACRRHQLCLASADLEQNSSVAPELVSKASTEITQKICLDCVMSFEDSPWQQDPEICCQGFGVTR